MPPSMSMSMVLVIVLFLIVLAVLWTLLPFAVFGIKPMIKSAQAELEMIRRALEAARADHQAIEKATRDQITALRELRQALLPPPAAPPPAAEGYRPPSRP